MGFGISASIGAAFATKKQPMYLVEGDGSFHMNIQDLAVISAYKLPISIIILNNNGYSSIRNTQRNYFDSRFCGTGPEDNLCFPSLKSLSEAYGLKYNIIKNVENLYKLKNLLRPKIFSNN